MAGWNVVAQGGETMGLQPGLDGVGKSLLRHAVQRAEVPGVVAKCTRKQSMFKK